MNEGCAALKALRGREAGIQFACARLFVVYSTRLRCLSTHRGHNSTTVPV